MASNSEAISAVTAKGRAADLGADLAITAMAEEAVTHIPDKYDEEAP